MKKKREIELDILRIISMFAVILVHVCGMKTHELSINDKNWQILTFIAYILTWEIPAFVMISGRFFLDPERDMPTKKIVKSITRLVLAFVVWDVIYQIYYIANGVYSNLNWKGIFSQAVQGPYHFWYLYMLIPLYAIVPFLRKITQEKRLMEYFIILFLAFEFLINYGVNLPFVGATLEYVLVRVNFNFALGYSGYFILGYYLYKYKIPNKIEFLLYFIAIMFIFGGGVLTVWRSVKIGENDEFFTKYLMPNVAIESIAIYTFFVKRVSKIKFKKKIEILIAKLSEYSFGVYLIHALVLEFIAIAGLSPIMYSPYFMVPIIAIIACVVSNIIVCVLRKIPVIGKKIT